MKKYLTDYITEIESKLKDKVTHDDLVELEKKISFFQHERLIHLLVTLFFAIYTFIFMALGMVSYLFLIPGFILMVFLTCYILYYYFLENRVQYLYKLYDQMREKINKK